MDALGILPQQLVFGLALGAIYGLIALGYTMVYGILLMINFAHGELFMIGAYVGWGVLIWLINANFGGLHPVWVVPLMLLMAMSVSGILGMSLERFAYRPLYMRGATRLGPLISAVGASIFLQNEKPAEAKPEEKPAAETPAPRKPASRILSPLFTGEKKEGGKK